MKQNLQLADISPRSLPQGETPRLIDEWQMAPKLWDAVRFEVDHQDGFGHFLLIGSAVPAEMDQVHHTGTGRFAWIKMRPMSLYESGESSGAVSLRTLFSPNDKLFFAENKATLKDIAFLICRGDGRRRLSWKGKMRWYSPSTTVRYQPCGRRFPQ